jgi:peroxiredoxin Q/BCP
MPKPARASADTALALGDGRHLHLSDYRGRWLVLYFYPKDNTPGCTLEGIDFNAHLADFRKAGAEILGVSRDSVKSHAGFWA